MIGREVLHGPAHGEAEAGLYAEVIRG